MAKADKRSPDEQKQGKALRDEGAKWLNRVDAAGKLEKQWLDDADIAVKAFTGETSTRDYSSSTALGTTYDFNILYANVETIVPAVINSPPAPDVRRRFSDDDPAGKDVAQILERAIKVQVDDGKLQVELEGQAQDAFLAGRGIVRLRFKSDFVKDATDGLEAKAEVGSAGQSAEVATDKADAGAGYDAENETADPVAPGQERLANERIEFEAVSWRDYRHGPAKRWADRPWEAFRFILSRENEDTAFDSAMIGMQTTDQEKKARGESDSDLVGWEIWCKASRKVYFIDDTGVMLKTVDDPLGLTNFFPIATPVQPIELTGRLMPVNPFSVYSKLADELDLTTKRIKIITNHMKVKGWYSGDAGDIANMLAADDTEFVPIGNAEIWAANGGLSGAVAFWPVEKFILVLRELYTARDQTKQAIYEITGISDIVRGASQASETLGAQQIKTQWGSLRIQKMQRMMERGARDLFVMMSEIIPAKFSHETLQQMTGIQLIPTQQDLTPVQPPPPPPQGAQVPPEMMQQYQQAAQAAQEAEKARQAKVAQMQAVQALLGQKLSTMYRIDVESDSTVKADLSRQKAEAAEFLQGAGAYWAAVGPMVQSGELPKEVAVEIFAANSRLFNLGKSVEDVLDKMITDAKAKAQNPPAPQPNAQQQAAEAKAKAGEADAAAKANDAKIKAAQAEQDMQNKRELHGMTMQEKQLDLQMKRQQARTDQNQALLANGIVPPPDPEIIDGPSLLKEMAAQRDQFGQLLAALIQELAKPKQIVRDAQGRAVTAVPIQTAPTQNPGVQANGYNQ
ncbi:hypothetical protein [Mesorhizobium sp. BR1-1-4]|uniref:hypothetical protein n=1 Tax=Mesorhizobium sp. BR1-1-4 TaxID=2876650 RepID=UPI001CCDBB25|nr:hypothetical protein [Mesorhizobium sp. BR1-1-4]MBZ9926792.1 hypothetical protein [Mesorhizobium sp. BR1-1-4]